MSPLGEVFDAVYTKCLEATSDVYDYVKPKGDGEDRPYPYIYVGEATLIDSLTKTQVNGQIVQTVHFWALREQRRELNDLMAMTQQEIRKLDRTPNYRVTVRRVNPEIIPDNNSNQPLLHGVLDFEIYFS